MYALNNRKSNYVYGAKNDGIARKNRLIYYHNLRLHTPLSEIETSSSQKIHKDTIEFNNTINQLYKIDNCIILHPTTVEYTFSGSYRTHLSR